MVNGGIPYDIAFTIIEYNMPSKEYTKKLFSAMLKRNSSDICERVCRDCRKFISPYLSDYYYGRDKYYCPTCLRKSRMLQGRYLYGTINRVSRITRKNRKYWIFGNITPALQYQLLNSLPF